MKATKAELVSAKVPPHLRDYCAHLFINFKACKRDKFPFVYRCHHERHEYETCEYEEYVILSFYPDTGCTIYIDSLFINTDIL
jgi:NADH dehydrogenase (ubiquinone) 1 beta subcomplex subunit 7